MKCKSVFLLLLIGVICAESKSIYGIGARVEGDKLLITDTLRSPTRSIVPKNHTIQFQYPISELVSYIELSSNSNVHAEFILSYDNALTGQATAIEALDFELKISIYGIDSESAPKNFHSILNPEIDFSGVLTPILYDESDEYYDIDDDDDFILVLGDRQPGDYLLYENLETSDITDLPTNHSVTFYYIDRNYLTCAEFVTIKTNTAGAIYSHVSDHSLKAFIYDAKTFSLAVKISIYGYRPEDKPEDFAPLLPAASESYKIPRKLDCLISTASSLGNKFSSFVISIALIFNFILKLVS